MTITVINDLQENASVGANTIAGIVAQIANIAQIASANPALKGKVKINGLFR